MPDLPAMTDVAGVGKFGKAVIEGLRDPIVKDIRLGEVIEELTGQDVGDVRFDLCALDMFTMTALYYGVMAASGKLVPTGTFDAKTGDAEYKRVFDDGQERAKRFNRAMLQWIPHVPDTQKLVDINFSLGDMTGGLTGGESPVGNLGASYALLKSLGLAE